MSIALERAKRPAPVWRCYSGKQDSARLSSKAGSPPGARADTLSNLCRRMIW